MKLDFPSLGAASTVEYEGSDDEGAGGVKKADEGDVEDSPLKPKAVTKDGRLYNSFKSYKVRTMSEATMLSERQLQHNSSRF